MMERRHQIQGKVLRQWLNEHIWAGYAEYSIPVTVGIAKPCASLHVPDPIPDYDAMIAATALEYGLTVVTRNTGDFEKTGVKLLNPFS